MWTAWGSLQGSLLLTGLCIHEPALPSRDTPRPSRSNSLLGPPVHVRFRAALEALGTVLSLDATHELTVEVCFVYSDLACREPRPRAL
ncbi:hypothetical protein LZ30DRAFT_266057 [Colletotrichum cereale]|nr:hypothetical protein LZ30DRAFT_266057 [Colletotrichum cereale]